MSFDNKFYMNYMLLWCFWNGAKWDHFVKCIVAIFFFVSWTEYLLFDLNDLKIVSFVSSSKLTIYVSFCYNFILVSWIGIEHLLLPNLLYRCTLNWIQMILASGQLFLLFSILSELHLCIVLYHNRVWAMFVYLHMLWWYMNWI